MRIPMASSLGRFLFSKLPAIPKGIPMEVFSTGITMASGLGSGFSLKLAAGPMGILDD